MASPVVVKLTCPNCSAGFEARTMGSSYFISGMDTDLRELGSIEEVRRYSVATCQYCRYSDYAWNFLEAERLGEEERRRLQEALDAGGEGEGSGEARPAGRGRRAGAPRRALSRSFNDFERLHLTALCFQARGLDLSSHAEVALLTYYVARDLGRRDLEPHLRDEAISLFARTLEEEDLAPPLRLRYAYLLGELSRRAGRREEALQAFDQAIAVAAGADLDDPDGEGAEIPRLALRMRATVRYRDAAASELLALTRSDEPEVGSVARQLLAHRRDQASVEATREAWEQAPPEDRTVMLRELATDPPRGAYDALIEALDSPSPEDVRLAARALGALRDPRAGPALLATLERGVLSAEAAICEALRRIEAPDRHEGVARVLERWEREGRLRGEDSWTFSCDPTPLRFMLYTSGEPHGLELLVRDLQELQENDLWDKVPSGGPVSAVLILGDRVALALRGLLAAPNPATRRWAAYCLAEMGAAEARDDLRPLVQDPEPVVRLQAATALAQLGDPSHEQVVLDDLSALPADDLPFALHFLLPFRSDRTRAFLLRVLRERQAHPGEVLPLLGRQEGDDEVQELLNTALLDTDDETRAGAVTGLSYQGSEAAAERLRLLYDGDESDEVRRRIVFGLGRLAGAGQQREAALRFLRDRLNRGNPRLRFAIALTLLKLDDPSGIDLVRERAALFDESFERYDLVAPALKELALYARRHPD